MAKMVGLSRNLKLDWLNKTVEFLLEKHSEEEVKAALNEYLSVEIGSATNLRKTREILMKLWVYENENTQKLRTEGIRLFQKFPKHKLLIHWCILLVTYPVFADICRIIDKIAYFQEEIIIGQLKQKLYDEWGERPTLYHSVDKLIKTMKDLNTLENPKTGKYRVVNTMVEEEELVIFILHTLMLLQGKSYYTLSELVESPYFFPFSYTVDNRILLLGDKFKTNNFAGELSFSLKDN